MPHLLVRHVWIDAARGAELARRRAALPAARHVLSGSDCSTTRGKARDFPTRSWGRSCVACPCHWGSGSATLVSDVAVTEKSDHFRACGTGFHCSSLMGSSSAFPYGAFSFSLPFQPFPTACHGGAHGLWLITPKHLSPFPLAGCSNAVTGLREGGERLTVHMEEEHVSSSHLQLGLSLVLNRKGMSFLCHVSVSPSEPTPSSSHP